MTLGPETAARLNQSEESHAQTLPLGPVTLKDRYGQKQKLKEYLRVPWGMGDLHRQGRVFRIQKGQW